MRRLVVQSILLIIAVQVASAGTISLISSSGTTTYGSGSAAMEIDKNSAWADALPGSSWVSTAKTGDTSDPGYVILPQGTQVVFGHSFFISHTITGASLSVRADDTTAVLVNGVEIFAAADVEGPNCTANPIGCLASTTRTFTGSELTPFLIVGGVNTIEFAVVQKYGTSFGLNYAGELTEATGMPEPGTFLLLGGGLLGITWWRRSGPRV